MSRKDSVRGNGCSTNGNQAWREPDIPVPGAERSAQSRDQSHDPARRISLSRTMGHPRDLCHAHSTTGSCADGSIGDGIWDRDAYFHVNYGWDHATWEAELGLSDIPTLPTTRRTKVYLWEAANPRRRRPTDRIPIVMVAQGAVQVTQPRWASSWTRPPTAAHAAASGIGTRPILHRSAPDVGRRHRLPDPSDPNGRDMVSRAIGWTCSSSSPSSPTRAGPTTATSMSRFSAPADARRRRTNGVIFRRDVPQLLE